MYDKDLKTLNSWVETQGPDRILAEFNEECMDTGNSCWDIRLEQCIREGSTLDKSDHKIEKMVENLAALELMIEAFMDFYDIRDEVSVTKGQIMHNLKADLELKKEPSRLCEYL